MVSDFLTLTADCFTPCAPRAILLPMDHRDRAIALFMSGYNCAQSTAAAFAEDFGISRAEVLKMTAGFGGGVGGLREICGAVSGMAYAAGLAKGNYDPNDKEAKTAFYALIQDAHGEFTAQFGTGICRELLEKSDCSFGAAPSERTAAYYAERPCARFVGEAAAIIAKKLKLTTNGEPAV